MVKTSLIIISCLISAVQPVAWKNFLSVVAHVFHQRQNNIRNVWIVLILILTWQY
jgi:hypothetical protein